MLVEYIIAYVILSIFAVGILDGLAKRKIIDWCTIPDLFDSDGVVAIMLIPFVLAISPPILIAVSMYYLGMGTFNLIHELFTPPL